MNIILKIYFLLEISLKNCFKNIDYSEKRLNEVVTMIISWLLRYEED